MSRSVSLLDHFSALKDPRESWRVLYPLPEILLLVLCATLAGMEGFAEIRLWGKERLEFLRRLLPYERGIPSHDVLNDVMNALDAEFFKRCFMDLVASLRDTDPEIIAIDGKTSRRTHARKQRIAPLHLVSAWASRQRLVLGQEAVAGKSNEIVAEIARTIVEGGGEYMLSLKANWPALLAEVETVFADPANALHCQVFETCDADHGRLERRRHVVSHDVEWLRSDRRFPDERRFPRLTTLAMVESTTERDGKTQTERRYYIHSARLDAETFAHTVRAHWGVENRLHWVLDVVFHDDLSRLRTGFGPLNMAIVNHIAMNLIRHPKACLNPDYLESLIRNQPSLT